MLYMLPVLWLLSSRLGYKTDCCGIAVLVFKQTLFCSCPECMSRDAEGLWCCVAVLQCIEEKAWYPQGPVLSAASGIHFGPVPVDKGALLYGI